VKRRCADYARFFTAANLGRLIWHERDNAARADPPPAKNNTDITTGAAVLVSRITFMKVCFLAWRMAPMGAL
jgi:hypothetical protein